MVQGCERIRGCHYPSQRAYTNGRPYSQQPRHDARRQLWDAAGTENNISDRPPTYKQSQALILSSPAGLLTPIYISSSPDQKTKKHTMLKVGLRAKPSSAFRPLAVRGFIKTIPQPPGNIVGTVNDAYVPPPPHKLHGSLHWTSERVVAIGMAPLIMTPFVTGTSYPLVDSVMGTLLLYHCYVGFESCIIDYIPLRVYGIWHKVAIGLLGFGTLVAGYGVYLIEKTEKEGLVGVVKKLWKA
ncbi:hypothetical protein KL919_003630 [Ogataea angusta]|nr:hypothetical protein KL920_005317 [Ogataea angusta]KAG7858372.1 hypothetical protein KL919_003630 [Ogataea angusta]